MVVKKDRGTSCHGRFLPVLLFVLLTFIPLRPLSAIAEYRVVTVGVYENAPKIFTSESGQPAGVFIDIIEHIAKLEGWTLRYVSGTWGEGLDRLAKWEIDLMPDVAYTVEREKIYTFHKVPVLSSWFQVYARKGSGIQSILNLNEKRILVLERSVQQEAFTRLSKGFGLKCDLLSVPDYGAMFHMVAKGEADAAITNRFYGMMHAKKFGLEDTAVVFEPSDLFFAAPKNVHWRLPDTIDRHLSELKKDPESVYYESLKQWTSEDFPLKIPGWLQLSGLAVSMVLLMSLVGSVVLKHQVNARTRELKEINQEMEQRILQRTAELVAAMEKAQAADRIKSAFLATMSHELRTPLNSIIGFTGIMLQGLAGPLNPEQQKQMTMVQNSSRHLLSLINDVLDISKIEAGQLELAPTAFDLRSSLEKTVKLVTPLAEKKGIGLGLDIADTVGTITADQRRLEQVVLNLVNNAVKFTDTGHVHISCWSENDHCLLAISDSGIGMRPEELAGIFQPFHQIDTGLARKREGTGLGLSICKKILDMMGGEIGVESQWGQGSTFTVRIPGNAGALK
ncbi:MAG: ATP-binding protein [Pseudomonadota bacterium]